MIKHIRDDDSHISDDNGSVFPYILEFHSDANSQTILSPKTLLVNDRWYRKNNVPRFLH